jgi:hypothetical protein
MSQNPLRTLYSYKLESAVPPPGTKYLLIVFKTTSVFVPGDERSRTNPGHGYPSGNETFKTPEIYAFPSEEELTLQVKDLALKRDFDQNKLLIVEVGNFLRITTDIQVGFIK